MKLKQILKITLLIVILAEEIKSVKSETKNEKSIGRIPVKTNHFSLLH